MQIKAMTSGNVREELLIHDLSGVDTTKSSRRPVPRSTSHTAKSIVRHSAVLLSANHRRNKSASGWLSH